MGEYIPDEFGPLSSCAIPLPGPLDYDPKLPPSGVQYSILGKHAPVRRRRRPRRNAGPPGPNKYDIRTVAATFSDAPHWSFGVKLKESASAQDEFPSPFAYNDTHKTFGRDGFSYTMSGWSKSEVNETPGPDRYFPDPKSHPIAGASPKWSFGLKPDQKEETTPGPQSYHVRIVPPCAPAAPSYTIGARVGAQVFSDKEDAHRPGCNEYSVKLQWSEKAASLKGWYKESKTMKTPGPANYIMPNALFSGPQYSVTGKNVPYEDEDYYVAPPGPADYRPTANPTLTRAPRYSLGARWRERALRDDGPCPRTYDPRDRQIRGNDGPKATLKGRYTGKIAITPGPADYDAVKDLSQALSAAQLARIDKMKQKKAEDAADPQSQQDQQQQQQQQQRTPGPADYEPKPVSVTKPSGPKYSLAARLAARKPENTPGPNAYRAAPRFDGPRISMKSRMSPFVLVFPSQRVDTLRV
ncbi:hypothetical protein DFJ73DRAFT_950642 [Zopfochytrium polystomum]|nr:hypothetical protein DFJ73DRAFT_950642 [Zopfochytrium polystomum]